MEGFQRMEAASVLEEIIAEAGNSFILSHVIKRPQRESLAENFGVTKSVGKTCRIGVRCDARVCVTFVSALGAGWFRDVCQIPSAPAPVSEFGYKVFGKIWRFSSLFGETRVVWLTHCDGCVGVVVSLL